MKTNEIVVKQAIIWFILILGMSLVAQVDPAHPDDFTPPKADPCPDGSCDNKRPHYVEVWPDGNYSIVIREWLLLRHGTFHGPVTEPPRNTNGQKLELSLDTIVNKVDTVSNTNTTGFFYILLKSIGTSHR